MPRRSHVSRHRHVGPPQTLHSLLEARAFAEFAALPLTLPLLMEAPQGDGHPVLLVPSAPAVEAEAGDWWADAATLAGLGDRRRRHPDRWTRPSHRALP